MKVLLSSSFGKVILVENHCYDSITGNAKDRYSDWVVIYGTAARGGKFLYKNICHIKPLQEQFSSVSKKENLNENFYVDIN